MLNAKIPLLPTLIGITLTHIETHRIMIRHLYNIIKLMPYFNLQWSCLWCLLMSMGFISSCTPTPDNPIKVNEYPTIYPDYTNVTIPVNIAPLNFLLRDSCDAIYVVAESDTKTINGKCKGNQATFDINEWKKLLNNSCDKEIKVTVSSRHNGEWTEYRPFDLYVSSDSIDGYLTYRLIEPDYEVFSRLQIKERCIENFDERTICDYNMVGNRCMNCHTFAQGNPDLSFMYVRGEGGGLILNQNGKLRKLNLKTPDMVSGSVYAQFSPSGRYLAFSSNVIIPSFHSQPSKRLEVFDSKSDIYVADLATNRIFSSPLLTDSLYLETFPTFSPDEKYLYFCTSSEKADPAKIDSLQYHLCRIAFDMTNASFGEKVDTILRAKPGTKSSICHPRISPDGRYLLYTVADYGTFPIWHPESDQQLLDLNTGAINNLTNVNSNKSDTYHSWASSGRWFVFASKRDDGLYGKPYFCHINSKGEVSKPFVLPQKSPLHYDFNLKSYNVPELGKSALKFNAAQVAEIMKEPSETFR